jgi:hypothetical protein
VSSFELDQLLLTLNHSLGMTTVIVTHELQSIFAVADACIMLDRARARHHRPRPSRDAARHERRPARPRLLQSPVPTRLMATTATNHWKLGLFVVVGLVAMVGALFWLGARRFQRTSFPAVSYFDESVQGLDVGSPVKFRGVTVGNVADITIAPDHRHVQVTSDIYVDALQRLGLGDRAPAPGRGVHEPACCACSSCRPASPACAFSRPTSSIPADTPSRVCRSSRRGTTSRRRRRR